MAGVTYQKSNIKNQKEREELPRNSRSIPDEVKSQKEFPRISQIITERNVWITGAVVVVGVLIVLLSSDLLKTIQEKHQLDQKRDQVQLQIGKWEQVIHQHPDYRDGYFMLATLTYQEGDMTSALAYTKKTIAIDPNFSHAQTLKKLLEIKVINK